MHVVIINGSPRIEEHSNTDKIITAFGNGLADKGVTFEKYAISNRNSWEKIQKAYLDNEEILIALPLFTENVPGLLLEFLETLPKKDAKTRISFILQSGFAEGCQLRCGEAFLKKLSDYLGVRYGGCLVKGNNFCIRILEKKLQKRITEPYRKMGALFAKGNGFNFKEAKRFTGPETYPLPIRLILQVVFNTALKKQFNNAAASWGCSTPLDAKPWEENHTNL